jgi:hypothetical protein
MADGVTAKLGEAHVEVRIPLQLLQKDLDQAKVQTQRATVGMGRGFEQLKDGVTQTSRALFGLRGTIGEVFAALLIREAAIAFRAMADEIEDIGIKAKTIGLTTDQFQELAYAARQADVSTEELNTALAFFAKGFGQAQAGVGPFVETLKKIDPETAKALKGAKNMQEALDIAADSVSTLASAEEKAAVITALFGRSGIGMARLFGEGSEQLKETGKQAKELGQVFNEVDIDKGGRISDAFTEASKAIRHEFMAAMLQLEPLIVSSATASVDLAKGIRELVGEFGSGIQPAADFIKILSALPYAIKGIAREFSVDALDLSRNLEKTLVDEISKTEERIAKLRESATNPGPRAVGGSFLDFQIGPAEQQLAKLQERLKGVREEISKGVEAQRTADFSKGLSTETVDRAPKEGRRLKPTLSDEELKKIADERKAAQDQLRDFHIQFLRDTEQLTDAIQAEQEKELANFQEMLNKKLITEDQYIQARAELAEITAKKLAEVYEKELKGVIEAIQTVGRGLEDAFGEWVDTGEFNAKEMVRKILAELAKLTFAQGVIQPLFGGGDTKGGGLFGSLLGGLFGGGSGGWDTSVVQLHKGGLVGQDGRMMKGNAALWANAPRLHDGLMPDEYRAILQRGEMVIPKGGGMGGMTINVDARGAEVGVETRVVAAIRAMKPELDRNAVAAVGRTRNKSPGYLR